VIVVGLTLATASRAEPPAWPLYERYCLACHGALGDGRGPAAPYTYGRPRSFARGQFYWRTTGVGQPPSDDDLRAAIAFGAPGSSMPGFGDVLAPAQIEQLIAIVKSFAPAAFAVPGTPIALPPAPPPDPARGEVVWNQLCRACHGTGNSDGPSAFALGMQPYPLAQQPVRRPRDIDDRDSRRRAAAWSIVTGLTGTPMGSFAKTLSPADIWAAADHVVTLNARTRSDHYAIDPAAVELDRKTPIAVASWPGHGDADDAKLFAVAIPPQGPPPASLAPAEASLDARRCARCHVKQYGEWERSRHRGAMSLGVVAMLAARTPDEQAACLRCHAPLAEQGMEESLRAQGASCAGCHVRDWTRHGPPRIATSLVALASYPLVTHGIYERSDLCLPCHQMPPRTEVAGKPLLDTYREWLEGPYMRRGVQCQHCHMANREHAVLGIHDAQTFREGIALTASAHRVGGAVSATAELRNVGAGHSLPTTPAPAVWLALELVDARGAAIPGTRHAMRIGRDVVFEAGAWRERADTRIRPGDSAALSHSWQRDGAVVRVSVEVQPEAYYEAIYAGDPRFAAALAAARATRYVAERRDIPVR
jgi:mono/diheme cytochrome c family protein